MSQIPVNHPRSIAVAQTVPIRGDVEANLKQHLYLSEIASELGAQVLVFPELSLTGYEIDLAGALAFSTDDRRLEPLIDAAALLSMILIAGAPVRVDSQLVIGALILHPDRSVELYTKHRLGAFPASACCDGIVPPAEATVFVAGTRNPFVSIGGSAAAIAVCADIGQPAHPRRAADRGAKNYLASMFVIPSEFDGEMVKLQSYAAKHSMVVAFSNYGGPTGGLVSAGRSAIWSERGELLVQLEKAGMGVAVAFADEQSPPRWTSKSVMV